MAITGAKAYKKQKLEKSFFQPLKKHTTLPNISYEIHILNCPMLSTEIQLPNFAEFIILNGTDT